MAESINPHILLACAEREVKMRKRVYPRWVEAKRMTAATAAEEIAHMEAIAAHFRALAVNTPQPGAMI